MIQEGQSLMQRHENRMSRAQITVQCMTLCMVVVSLLIVCSVPLQAEPSVQPWPFQPIPQEVFRWSDSVQQRECEFYFYSPARYREQPYKLCLQGCDSAMLTINGTSFPMKNRDDGSCEAEFMGYQIPGGFNLCQLRFPAGVKPVILFAHPGDVWFYRQIPESENPRNNINTWKSLPLSNGLVVAQVAQPDIEHGIYRGHRFEQAGIVTQLRYQDKQFFLEAPENNQPLNNDWGISTVAEFLEPIGWQNATPGEPYIKIGVGLLRRAVVQEEKWNEWPYILKRFPWEVIRHGENSLEFRQDAKLRDLGYQYSKTLTLVPGKPVLMIEHSLKNTGSVRFVSSYYIHNWIVLGSLDQKGKYTAHLHYAPRFEGEPSSSFQIDDKAVTAGNSQPCHTVLSGWQPNPSQNNYCCITRQDVSYALSIQGDYPTVGQELYADQQVLCYEAFKAINLAPGETTSWKVQYTFDGQDYVQP
jgi:hypothetical protein